MMALTRSGLWLLPLVLLTACFHWPHHQRNQSLAPPIPRSTVPPPELVHVVAPLPEIPSEVTESELSPQLEPEPSPMPHVHHRRRAVNKDVEEASDESPGVSAIGQLSSGDPSDLRVETVDSIEAIEYSLKHFNRRLNSQEHKTVAQILEFIKQAKAALGSGDADGAHTLTLKAKVLLGELSK